MSINDITGARLISKANTKEYEEGYDRIWGHKRELEIKALFAMTKEMKFYEETDAMLLKGRVPTKNKQVEDECECLSERCVIHDNEVDVIND